jgi:signal transduction histidine kinase
MDASLPDLQRGHNRESCLVLELLDPSVRTAPAPGPESLAQQLAEAQAALSAAATAGRLKDHYLATLCHELRQPLAAGYSALEVLRISLSPERRQRAAEIIEEQLRHVARLVDYAAEMSEASRHGLSMRREAADLRQLVERALAMTAPLFVQHGHRVQVTLGAAPLWLRVEPTRMVQAFANLLKNAANYTPPGGEIAVMLTQSASQVCFRVRDNGIGISRDALERIFVLFEQQQPNSAAAASHGIGLAVVRQVVEAHGGTVAAQSDGDGLGSEFVVVLPAD